MIFFLSFCFVGCSKDEEDMEDFEEETESDSGVSGDDYGIPDGMVAPLYGTKLLYRPNDYNYNTGSGGTEGNENNYYGQYAWNVINSLYNTYGIVNDSVARGYLGIEDSVYSELKPYLYDSIRYQVDIVGTVKKQKQVDASEPTGYKEIDVEDYQIVGSDYSKAWNWSFAYDLTDMNALVTYLAGNGSEITFNGQDPNVVAVKIPAGDSFASYVDSMYVSGDIWETSKYQSIYLGTTAQVETPTEKYSPFVKALEYALYNLALDVNPQRITINHDKTNPDKPVTILVGNPAKTLDEALAMAKATFEANGTYVGLSQRQINKLGDWIMDNVIGYKADDNFTTYDEVYEVLNADGTFSHYEFVGNPTPTKLGRNYETAVDNILQANFEKVKIGNEAGGDPTINQAFLSSEVIEYCGEGFFVDGDEWFATDEFMQSNPLAQKLPYIPAREYQSAVFMPMSNWELRGIYVALKYDADGKGTDEQWGEEKHGYGLGGRWDADLYIDIVVELNYYSVKDRKTYKLGSKKCRVYDGPFDPFFSNSFVAEDQYDEWGNVHFGDFDKVLGEDSDHLKGKNLVVGAYNLDKLKAIGTFADVGDYFTNHRSIAPIKLVGTTSQRNFYKLIEPTDDELAEYGTDVTYSTGQLDSTQIGEACDYLEVTYKVLKDTNDLNKNYKFYTAISGVW